jgi:hypothetical protein
VGGQGMSEYRMAPRADRTQQHSQLLRVCEEYIRLHGGWTLRIAGGVAMRRGAPDVVAVLRQHQTGEGAMVVIEAKTGKGRLTGAQEQERARWEDAGAVYVLARQLEDVEDALYDAGLIAERSLWPRREEPE